MATLDFPPDVFISGKTVKLGCFGDRAIPVAFIVCHDGTERDGSLLAVSIPAGKGNTRIFALLDNIM